MRNSIFSFLFFIVSISCNAQISVTPTEVIQENLAFYNERNLDGFMSSFSDSITMFTFNKSDPIAIGKDAIRGIYKLLFETSPKLHSTIVHRSVIGNKVIDHESIIGRKGSDETVEIVMIYEVEGDKIVQMTVIRE